MPFHPLKAVSPHPKVSMHLTWHLHCYPLPVNWHLQAFVLLPLQLGLCIYQYLLLSPLNLWIYQRLLFSPLCPCIYQRLLSSLLNLSVYYGLFSPQLHHCISDYLQPFQHLPDFLLQVFLVLSGYPNFLFQTLHSLFFSGE